MSLPNLQEDEKLLFGQNTNLTKIQKLYAQALHFKAIDSIGADFTAVVNQLEAEIDKETPISNSPNYNRFIAMKALALLLHCGPHNSLAIDSENIKKAIALLEPIKTASEATMAYIKAMLEIDRKAENFTNLEYLLLAEAEYDRVVTNGISVLSTFEVFGAKSHLVEEYNIMLYHIFRKFSSLTNDMQRKYLLPSLKAVFNIKANVENTDFGTVKLEQLIPGFLHHVEYLIATHYFPQLDHILSVFMFKLVKAGREVVDAEQQPKIDEAKAFVSFWYARWAERLLFTAQEIVDNPDYASENPIRTEMVYLDELMEPDVEIYENLFPVEFLDDIREWNKVVKKGKLWGKRALQFAEKCNVPNVPSNDMQKFLKENITSFLKRFDKYPLMYPDV